MMETLSNMLRISTLFLTMLASWSLPVSAQPLIISRAGIQVPLYGASYALVIGASTYQSWPKLPNVLRETQQVATALKKQGFNVRFVPDPNGETLQNAFRDFFADYGTNQDNRLLVFFAGHGHSIGENGYLVPVDAPLPDSNSSLFLKRAKSMSQLVSDSKEYKARHALYVFDSCFSGAIFSTRSNPVLSTGIEDISRYLAGPASQPVRQFITAGSETQQVPEISQFTPLFIHAIEGRVAELNKSGFISAKDLGLWLTRNLATYTSNQTPRSGTVLDARFDRGDFVFGFQPAVATVPTPQPVQRAPASVSEKTRSAPNSALPSAQPICFQFNGRQFCE